MTNVEALKNLYTALGGNAADVADAVTNVDVLNAIAGFLGGNVDATSISEAIENISAVAPTGGGDIDALIDGSITEIKSSAASLKDYAFAYCSRLATAEFSNVTYVGIGAFGYCTHLTAVIIKASQIPNISMNAGGPFYASGIASGTGYIYVPDDLVDDYKAAEGWSTYANQIKGISELPTE